MRAVFIERHGGPDELKYGVLPDPAANRGQVVVDIHAASVNGADWKVRTGESYPQTVFPYVLGRDFSGVVSVSWMLSKSRPTSFHQVTASWPGKWAMSASLMGYQFPSDAWNSNPSGPASNARADPGATRTASKRRTSLT